METSTRSSWKVHLIVLYICVLWMSGTFTNAYHLGAVGKKTVTKSVKTQFNNKKTPINTGVTQKRNANISMATEISSIHQQKTFQQLELEIQELLRMKDQLNAELVSGANNAKKTKLLQHINNQILLRRTHQNGKKKSELNNNSVRETQITKTIQMQPDVQPKQAILNDAFQLGQPKQNPQIVQQQQLQNLPTNEQAQYRSTVGIKTFDSNNQINANRNVPNGLNHQTVILNDNLNQNQQQQLPIRNVPNGLNHQTVALNDNLNQNQQQQLQIRNVPNGLNHQTVKLNDNLNQNYQQQLPLQMTQQMSDHQYMQQRRPLILSDPIGMNQAQVSLTNQQNMNQTALQMSSPQHILIPINALSLNSLGQGNILSGERYVVLDSALQDSLQMNTVEKARIVQNSQQKPPSTISPTTASKQAEKITRTTTPLPTLATTPTSPKPSTHVPLPPTTARIAYAPGPINFDTFKQEFYSGEMQKQQLEITKLKLEIQDLRSKQMQMRRMSMGESENDDAPAPTRRLRFPSRRMPFSFF